MGCMLGPRNVTICRVLHTELFEVIEFAVPKRTLKAVGPSVRAGRAPVHSE